jgi:HD superfamily phosphohydrolase YqeK
VDKEEIKKKLRAILSKERYAHCLDVAKTAVRLAKIHSSDPKKAEIAGLLHDCAKHMKAKRLKSKLFHGFVSARMAKNEFGIKDKDTLNAIAHHTSGRIKMSKLEKIIYVSDHIEPGRKYRNVSKMRLAAKKSLERAIVLISSEMIKYLLEKKVPIFEQTLITRNYYLKNG